MSIIKVKKSASSWKGFTPYKNFRVEAPNNVVNYSKKKRKIKNNEKNNSLIAQQNAISGKKRFNDLYMYCRKSYQTPQSIEEFAIEMKKSHGLNNSDYYEAIFSLFCNLIDGKKIDVIDISMVKDIKNLFIHIKEDYDIKTSRLVAKLLHDYLNRKTIKTKKMNSLQTLCQEHLNIEK